jgi:hypothetical protein
MVEMRNVYRIMGNSEGKRPLEKLKYRWEFNIKMDFTEIGLESVELVLSS